MVILESAIVHPEKKCNLVITTFFRSILRITWYKVLARTAGSRETLIRSHFLFSKNWPLLRKNGRNLMGGKKRPFRSCILLCSKNSMRIRQYRRCCCGRSKCGCIAVAICFFLTRDPAPTHLSLCLFYVLLCVIQHCQCSSRARHSAPQQQQVVYYAHVADPRCTLSTTAISGVCCCCLRHIGLCTYLLYAVGDQHFLLRTDHPWIAANHSYKASRVQQDSYKNTLSYGLLCALHC